MKRLLIISPKNKVGQPARERTLAFVAFFEENGISCEVLRFPNGPFELFKLIWHVYKSGYKNVLVTMPPFRAWSLCLLPGVNTILDIRDGWSIAIGTGYGGTSTPDAK